MRKIALALGAVLQLYAGYLIWTDQALYGALLGHVVGACFWGWGAGAMQPWARVESRWFATVVALVIPGGGWVFSGVALAISNKKPPKSRGRTLIVWRDRNLRTEFGIFGKKGKRSSIAEILRGPNKASRRSAILAVKDLEVRVALPLLRKGLQDSDEQVRIYAQNILSSLLESFEARIKELEKRAAAQPLDVTTAVSLAEQYFELVYLDVAGDEETSDHLLVKAVTMLDEAGAQLPKDGHIALLRLRYALRQRDTDSAEIALQKLSSLSVDDQMVLPWRAELAFQRRDWIELKRILGLFLQKGFVNPRIESMAKFWRAGRVA